MKHIRIIIAFALVVILSVGMSGSDVFNAEKSNTVPPTAIEPPTDMLMPFDAGGKLTWDAAGIESAYVSYMLEYTENEARVADLSIEADVDTLFNILNGINKVLVSTYKWTDQNSGSDYLPPFANYNLQNEIYQITVTADTGYILNNIDIYKTNVCVYIGFYIDKPGPDFAIDCFLYQVNLSDLDQLAPFLEGLDKRWEGLTKKPVIYLYPTQPAEVSVKLAFDGWLTATDPLYGNGWDVTAYPDGRLINKADGKTYPYLFWEGIGNKQDWDMSEGWCVKGTDTEAFLRSTLGRLGLTPAESGAFIAYWLPSMGDNPYNLITFQWDDYAAAAPLAVSPAPDSLLRVFMVFQPLDAPVSVPAPPERPAFARDGFTVVEWGGSEYIDPK